MRVLVTGGQGFVGKYTVEQLLTEGHTVVEYGREKGHIEDTEEHTFVFGELNDVPRLVHTLKSFGIEGIIHLAGQSHPPLSVELPLMTVEANIVCTMGVLESARMCGIKRIVLCSSEAVYGKAHDKEWGTETVLHPLTPYGATKAAVEMIGTAYNIQYDMECISLRIGEVYGPGRKTSETIKKFLEKATQKEKIIWNGSGKDTIPLVYVSDAAKATVKAVLCDKIKKHNAVYNIVSEQPTIFEIVEVIKKLYPQTEIEIINIDNCNERQGKMEIISTERDLNYFPDIQLEEGITLYADYLKGIEIK